MWNRDELEGKMSQARGKAKRAAGELTKDERLKGEGESEEAVGKLQDTMGRGRRKVGEAIEDIGNDVKR